MKKVIWLSCLAFIFIMFVVNIQAQPPQGPPPPPPTAEQRAEHLDKLAKDLKLTDAQKAKFKQAEDTFFAKAEKLHEEGKPKIDALHQERDEAVKAILTTEQYAQLQKMEEARRKQGPPKRKKQD